MYNFLNMMSKIKINTETYHFHFHIGCDSLCYLNNIKVRKQSTSEILRSGYIDYFNKISIIEKGRMKK